MTISYNPIDNSEGFIFLETACGDYGLDKNII
jgi:hypothetical protein